MNLRWAAAAATFALAGHAVAAPALEGCWKMIDAKIERQSGKTGTTKPDCIRAYQGTTLVTACSGGKDVSVYALTDMTVATYSFAQVGRHVDGRESRVEAAPARAAAFRVAGNTLHMVLGRAPGASADPIVRAEQRLARLAVKECAALARHLPAGLPADAATHPSGADTTRVQPASQLPAPAGPLTKPRT